MFRIQLPIPQSFPSKKRGPLCLSFRSLFFSLYFSYKFSIYFFTIFISSFFLLKNKKKTIVNSFSLLGLNSCCSFLFFNLPTFFSHLQMRTFCCWQQPTNFILYNTIRYNWIDCIWKLWSKWNSITSSIPLIGREKFGTNKINLFLYFIFIFPLKSFEGERTVVVVANNKPTTSTSFTDIVVEDLSPFKS